MKIKMTRRPLLGAGLLLAAPERPSGRWRTRITTFKSGRATAVPLRFTFAKNGVVAIEEYRTGGQLAWLFRGVVEWNPADEVTLRVDSVTDETGQAAPEGRTRWVAGETYTLGAYQVESSTRVRIGSLELLKELE